MFFRESRFILLFLLIFPVFSSAQNDAVQDTLGYPDMVIYNAKIVTMDDASFTASPGTITQAMAIRDDKILAVGIGRLPAPIRGR
jgi:hypothetical protein